MKKFSLLTLVLLLALSACGASPDETPEALSKTIFHAIAKNDVQTYLKYAVYHDRDKVLTGFIKARLSGQSAGVDWDNIMIRDIKLDDDNDYIVTFKSANLLYSIKIYSIEQSSSNKHFVKKTSVLGSVRRVRGESIN